MSLGEALQATLEVAAVLERLGVDFLVGGSFASSFHGVPRSTQDVDLVAELTHEHVERFVAALSSTFYVDDERMRQAIASRTSFNLIHLPTMFKVDVFVARDDAWSRRQLERRERQQIGDAELPIASAEDVVLHKLRWYELGNRSSERQWNDVIGVLKVRRDSLDREYLNEQARRLGVGELLNRAWDAVATP